MKTCVTTKNKIDSGMAMLALLSALLILGGCATSGNQTMTALTGVSHGVHEPITQVAFNTIDPYASELHNIETAGGTP